jgi:hypothetical protein
MVILFAVVMPGKSGMKSRNWHARKPDFHGLRDGPVWRGPGRRKPAAGGNCPLDKSAGVDLCSDEPKSPPRIGTGFGPRGCRQQNSHSQMPDKAPPVTEAEVIRMIHRHIEGLFPRTCPKCKRLFPTYRDYLLGTRHIGTPVSYDIEFDDLRPAQAGGNLSLANCSCGNTIALSSAGMPLRQIWQVLAWVKSEAEKRQVPVEKILTHLRTEVSKRGLA